MEIYTHLKTFVKPLVPPSIAACYSSFVEYSKNKVKRAKFERMRGCVIEKIDSIQNLSAQQCLDVQFLEHEFIPWLGLNNEALSAYPPELNKYCGSGLHIWQYPNQLAKLLVWMSSNAREVGCYMEIGCRWGGMFILISEWLRKHSPQMSRVIAVDLIEPTPLLEEYFSILQNEINPKQQKIEPLYICGPSTSAQVQRVTELTRPDFVFIDGDHSLKGALSDHMRVRNFARIIVHHDVISEHLDTMILWNTLKEFEHHDFVIVEFVDQYTSVKVNTNGFGILSRKPPLPLMSNRLSDLESES
jgi:hypothetical protein